MIKIFGIGNPLLKDDGIGLKVTETLKENEQVKIYQTEIFVEDALEQIEETDYVVIIDAVQLDRHVGEIHFLSFEECGRLIQPKVFCHEMSLLGTLLLEYPMIKGELIGIEIAEVDYGEELSFELSQNLSKIIDQVTLHINALIRKGISDA